MLRRVLPLVLLVVVSACNKSSPNEPSPPPATTPTRIISLSGNLSFGDVDINTSQERTFTIGNSGNQTLTYTALRVVGGTGSTGWAATPLTASIPPGGSQTVTVRFSPTLAQSYGGVLTVDGNQTSGNNGINISGSGVNNTPIWTQSGTGDAVFDMPTSVVRVRIQGTPTTSCQNFIVRIGGRASTVNVILGTCSVADAPSLDSTYLTGGGGVVQITSSTGIRWTFTEIR